MEKPLGGEVELTLLKMRDNKSESEKFKSTMNMSKKMFYFDNMETKKKSLYNYTVIKRVFIVFTWKTTVANTLPYTPNSDGKFGAFILLLLSKQLTELPNQAVVR